jgi:hypothetical protein
MEILSQNMGYIVIAICVIAGLILAMMLLRAIGSRVRGGKGARLSISEYHEIDKDRMLVLVRRDDREHLLLIGGSQDIVVESGIETEHEGASEAKAHRLSPRREPAARGDDQDENRPIPLRPSPRPAVFGERPPNLRPVGRDEPRLSSVPKAEEDDRA